MRWRGVAAQALAALAVGCLLAVAVAAFAWCVGIMLDAVSWALS